MSSSSCGGVAKTGRERILGLACLAVSRKLSDANAFNIFPQISVKMGGVGRELISARRRYFVRAGIVLWDHGMGRQTTRCFSPSWVEN